MNAVNIAAVPYHHGQLRPVLIEVATDLVRERGLDGWSLREVARLAGVSPTAVYRHFAGKDALLGEVAYLGYRTLADAMRAVRTNTDPEADLLAMGAAYLHYAETDPHLFRALFGQGASGVALGGRDPGALDELVAVVAELLGPDDAASAAVVLWATIHGLTMLVIDGQTQLTDARRAAGRALRATLIGLRAERQRALP